MSSDKVIKLWDLRNNRCMQTLTEKSWPHPSHAYPTAMTCVPRRNRIVTIQHQPVYWRHMCCADDQQGHSQPLIAVLYSPEFHLVGVRRTALLPTCTSLLPTPSCALRHPIGRKIVQPRISSGGCAALLPFPHASLLPIPSSHSSTQSCALHDPMPNKKDMQQATLSNLIVTSKVPSLAPASVDPT